MRDPLKYLYQRLPEHMDGAWMSACGRAGIAPNAWLRPIKVIDYEDLAFKEIDLGWCVEYFTRKPIKACTL